MIGNELSWWKRGLRYYPPHHHPETTANKNHWDVAVPPSTLWSQQAPCSGTLCHSGCKYGWTRQTLTLQGLAIIACSVMTDVINQISDWDEKYECQIGLWFVFLWVAVSAWCYTLAVMRLVAVSVDSFSCIFLICKRWFLFMILVIDIL